MYDASASEITGQTPGFRVNKARRPIKRTVPDWIFNTKELKKKILGPAEKRYRIAYLYWHLGYNAREVSEDVLLSVNAVKKALRRIRSL